MAFLVEDGTGLVAATSYLSVAAFKTYHTDRGNDFAAYSDETIQNALIQGTDYIDRKFLYIGSRAQGRDQSLEWPRVNAFDVDGNLIDSSSLPREITMSCAELALVALGQVLLPNIDFDSSGGFVTEQTQQVGSIKQTVKYSAIQGRRSFATYTSADAMLRRVAKMERRLVRAS